MFDPKKSIDFHGNTGSFIQYAYARIQSIIRKSEINYNNISDDISVGHKEKDLIKHLMLFPNIIKQSGEQYNPSMIVNYLFELVKTFNSFYQNVNILGEKELEQKKIRLILQDHLSGSLTMRQLYLFLLCRKKILNQVIIYLKVLCQ